MMNFVNPNTQMAVDMGSRLRPPVDEDRVKEIARLCKEWGEASESNTDWMQKIIDSNLNDSEKVFAAFLIGAILIDTYRKMMKTNQPTNDPMFG